MKEIVVTELVDKSYKTYECKTCGPPFAVTAFVEGGDAFGKITWTTYPQKARFCFWCGRKL